MKTARSIAHVDMDAFFAAIEQRDDPSLRSRPVIVGADPKGGRARGVVSTCSYEARAFGVHSAMPISIAYKRCPHAAFLPVDMPRYEAVSRQIYDILSAFTPDIEPVSIDEAFLDITGSHHLFAGPYETCLSIKRAISQKTGLTASCGLAPTKMAAKIASDLDKPDGMVEVKPDDLIDFLRPLSVRRLWGLGPKSEAVLAGMGIRTIGELAQRDAGELIGLFGKNGEELWRLARGIDESMVETTSEMKSVSNEVTFERDTSSRETIEGALMALSERVAARLRHEQIKGRTVTLKIRLEGFHTYTRAVTLSSPTNFDDAIYHEAKRLYEKFAPGAKKVRLVGVRVSGLVGADIRDTLFEARSDGKRADIYKAIDRIKERFGSESIRRAGGMMR